MPRKPGPQQLPPYEPSAAASQAIRAWKAVVAEEERLRHLAQEALADDLKADPDLPVSSVAEHPQVPWGIGTLWNIVTKYKVPPRQPNKAKKTEDV